MASSQPNIVSAGVAGAIGGYVGSAVSGKGYRGENSLFCALIGGFSSLTVLALSRAITRNQNFLTSEHSKIVFVSGCFDGMHSGHVNFLQMAAERGRVVVCVATDRAIINLKGQQPLLPQAERVYLVTHVKGVSQVVYSDDTGILNMRRRVEELRPNIWMVTRDADLAEKRQLCEILNIKYEVVERIPEYGISERFSTKLRQTYYYPEPLEIIAECVHDGWWMSKQRFDYSYGPRDRQSRTHPHMLPWLACGYENNEQDRRIAAHIMKYLQDHPSVTRDLLAAEIHYAWVQSLPDSQRQSHPHAKDSWEDHDEEGRDEHLTQANLILAVWSTVSKNCTKK